MAKLVKNYPENTRVCPWILTQDGNKNSIRRWVYLPDGGKVFERFPAIRYQHSRRAFSIRKPSESRWLF